jgi:hypothetical protein
MNFTSFFGLLEDLSKKTVFSNFLAFKRGFQSVKAS